MKLMTTVKEYISKGWQSDRSIRSWTAPAVGTYWDSRGNGEERYKVQETWESSRIQKVNDLSCSSAPAM